MGRTGENEYKETSDCAHAYSAKLHLATSLGAGTGGNNLRSVTKRINAAQARIHHFRTPEKRNPALGRASGTA
jgi:hypothetical protein